MHSDALDTDLWFPPVCEALDDGLLAIGGDLSVPRLLSAYRHGIFPWYNEGFPMWWCPDPRFVLFPDELKVSRSMSTLLKKHFFSFTINKAFDEVIKSCKIKQRKDQDGTWITGEMEAAYIELHRQGYAHSVEVWQNNLLVGGLYGVRLGSIFFGESMFSNVSNASKFAFIKYMSILKEENVKLIDCQVYTEHLESLGARMITRSVFIQILKEGI